MAAKKKEPPNSKALAFKNGAVLVATIVDEEGRDVVFDVVLVNYGITLVPRDGGAHAHLTWPQAYAAAAKQK